MIECDDMAVYLECSPVTRCLYQGLGVNPEVHLGIVSIACDPSGVTSKMRCISGAAYC